MPVPQNRLPSQSLQNKSHRIYPNPTAGQLEIAGLDGAYDIQVVDGAGRVLRTFAMMYSPLVADISDLPGGIYFVKIVREDGSEVRAYGVIKI